MSTPQHSILPGDSGQCAERRPGRTTGFGAGRLPCVEDAGHDGRHVDALRREWAETDVPEGPHTETARRAARHSRPFTPQDTRDANNDTDDVKACPVHGCALLAGHGGSHMSLDAEEFTNGPNGAAEATALAKQLTSLLAVRGNAAKIRHALRAADQVFDALHEHLRDGGPLPRGWAPGESADGQRYTTAWFDALSETLRDPNARPTLRATANAAEVAWAALDAALRAGKPMPEPWDGRRR